jgi:hypothetical protein
VADEFADASDVLRLKQSVNQYYQDYGFVNQLGNGTWSDSYDDFVLLADYRHNYITLENDTWIYDDSAPREIGSRLPYQSSIFINNVTYHLPAPLLDYGGNCTPHDLPWSYYGNCMCFNGKPIPHDWSAPANINCVSQKGYVWGFNSFLTIIGLVSQILWVVGTWAVWMDANWNSKLCRHRRRLGGTFRCVADLAEAMKADLGDEYGAYNEEDLTKALDKCNDVGYVVVKEIDGLARIRLAGIEPGPRSDLWVQEGKLYG